MQVVEERNKLQHRPPLLVKIAPDLSQKDKTDIAAVVTRQKVRDLAYVATMCLGLHIGLIDLSVILRMIMQSKPYGSDFHISMKMVYQSHTAHSID